MRQYHPKVRIVYKDPKRARKVREREKRLIEALKKVKKRTKVHTC